MEWYDKYIKRDEMEWYDKYIEKRNKATLVFITVKDGVVQDVKCTDPFAYILIKDWDNDEEGIPTEAIWRWPETQV
jgi:hypothetical protein